MKRQASVVPAALGLSLLLFAGGVASAGLPLLVPPPPAPLAWIDAPLSGSVVPLAPIEVVAHATDEGGVSLVELKVIGQDGPQVHEYDASSVMVLAEFTWEPPADGLYVLQVRGQGPEGGWGQPAHAVITVGDAAPASGTVMPSPTPSASASTDPDGTPGPSTGPGSATPGPTSTTGPTQPPTSQPTAAPTPTPTAVPTATPTPAPCTPAAPTLVSPSDGATISDANLNPPTFSWAAGGSRVCPPSGYRIQVIDPDQGTIHDVTLGPDTLAWSPPGPLPNCVTYYWRVASLRSNGSLGAWSGTWTVGIYARCG